MPKKKIVTATKQTQRSVESSAIYFAGFGAAVSLILALIYFGGKDNLPIFGRVSIGTTSIILASIASFIAYFSVIYQEKGREKHQNLARRAYLILSSFALAFIHGAIVFLLVTLGFYIVSEAFIGATIDIYASSVIVGLVVGITSYAMYLIASAKTTLLVSTALAVFLVSGVLTSMITAQDPYWWQMHLSSLGGAGGFSSYAFNYTLIIGGIVVICIADLIAEDLTRLKQANPKYKNAREGVVRWLLVAMGIFLAGVGLFPYNENLVLHNVSASGMVALFLTLIIGLRVFIPTFSKAYFTLSYIMLGAIVVSIYLFAVRGYFDLTAFEIICFAVVFSWLIVFIRQIAAELTDEHTIATAKLAKK